MERPRAFFSWPRTKVYAFILRFLQQRESIYLYINTMLFSVGIVCRFRDTNNFWHSSFTQVKDTNRHLAHVKHSFNWNRCVKYIVVSGIWYGVRALLLRPILYFDLASRFGHRWSPRMPIDFVIFCQPTEFRICCASVSSMNGVTQKKFFGKSVIINDRMTQYIIP